jgi:Putative peptidoglycan binding domain.
MKSLMFFVWCLPFVVAQVTRADDVVPSKPAAPPIARSAAGVHTSTVNTGRNRPAVRPNPDLRQGYPKLGQPIQRVPLAMNVQSSSRNYQAKQLPEELPQPMSVQKSPRNYQSKQLLEELQQQPRVSVNSSNLQRAKNNRRSYFDALKRFRHERHDCKWWEQRCRTIVFVNTGHYYLDAGYWYPAYGYDPAYDYYDYDGPIYTYGDLLPDQVIVNVQSALQEAGYYNGPITGSLNPGTRAAIANFQRDYGLIITGAIDEPTVASLGLN